MKRRISLKEEAQVRMLVHADAEEWLKSHKAEVIPTDRPIKDRGREILYFPPSD